MFTNNKRAHETLKPFFVGFLLHHDSKAIRFMRFTEVRTKQIANCAFSWKYEIMLHNEIFQSVMEKLIYDLRVVRSWRYHHPPLKILTNFHIFMHISDQYLLSCCFSIPSLTIFGAWFSNSIWGGPVAWARAICAKQTAVRSSYRRTNTSRLT